MALSSVPARADEDLATSVEKSEWLVQRGQVEQAQELLRRVAELHPNREEIAIARAKAYLADNNPFWALKVLGEPIAQPAPACAARAMAARVHLQEANLDQAEQVLDAPECEHIPEAKTRFLLLRTELAELRGERQRAAALVQAANDSNRRFSEDDARLTRLLNQYDRYRQPALAIRLDLGAGWVSHGAGTLPLDLPTASRQAGSTLVGMDLRARWLPVSGKLVRPVAEAELHLAQYLESPARDLSSRQPVLRLGVSFGSGPRRTLIAYATDWINLDGGSRYPNDSFTYSNGHRLEFRTDIGSSFTARSAWGYRSFWQSERSRRENEIGLAKHFDLSDHLRLTLIADSRVYRAERRVYDQVGATGSIGLDIAISNGFTLRESLALGYDFFPRSAGYFDNADSRLDKTVRVNAGLSTPEFIGLRFGLHYTYANRGSNAAAYEFTDHRSLVTVTWESDSDRWRVQRIPPKGRVAMPYPDDDVHRGGKTKSELIEVIQKDESQRRGSSCMK